MHLESCAAYENYGCHGGAAHALINLNRDFYNFRFCVHGIHHLL